MVMYSANSQFVGGQSIPKFDYDLAPYVGKTFISEIRDYLDDNEVRKDIIDSIQKELKEYHNTHNSIMTDEAISDIKEIIASNLVCSSFGVQHTDDDIDELVKNCINKAIKRTDRATYQAMEAFIHNLNTMNCLPSYERIWVIDTHYRGGELKLLSMKEVYDSFESNRYLALSYNKVDDVFEWKPITNCVNNGKRDALIITTSAKGMCVATTDNHRFLVRNSDDNVVEAYPKDISEILISKDMDGYVTLPAVSLDHYHSRKKQNYLADHIPLTESFAELLGYYVADGSVVGGSQLVFSVCDYDLSLRIKDIMAEIYGESISYKDIYRNNKYIETRFNVGKVWTSCFKDICGDSAHTKKIPSIILQNRNLDYLKKFLYGYLYCDAKCCNYVEATTVSYELSRDLLFAFYRLGEIPYIKELTKSTSFCKSGIFHGYNITIGNKAIQRIGLSELLTHNATFEIRKDNKITKNLFATDSNYVEMPYNGDVFDITVADNENFVTADGILVHNSRAGAQVPFSSINYGTDTSPEGRMIIKNILLAQEAGLGNGETPIFPIAIFKVKEGINYNPEDPNYDLFKLSFRVSAKRLFPNYSFIDSPYNLQFYKEGNPDTEIAYMGCIDYNEKINVDGYIKSNSRSSIGKIYDAVDWLYNHKDDISEMM